MRPCSRSLVPVDVEPVGTLQPARVVRVIEGDTVDVDFRRRAIQVRYIGIDTPEPVHPTRGVEAYGKEGSERKRQLVESKTVFLGKDVSETERYGRLLRYVLRGRYVGERHARAGSVCSGSKHTHRA